ncbi:MAG: EAL domain-containing protein [Planctomycetia bacterium]|nr:EAL domain-containing protein [Candidatus Brocadia sp.]QOJ05831.1 MAG: EAL domain-containing protein [Planctomycetia bacterium]TVL96058.1 MAG: diguanylate cyclase [Candidatus Brocadia sp. BL1]HQU30964.1 EAL domain-containing protein [Candidatus Brocadia sapporoensis]
MNINRIKILLVDDDEDDYVIVRELVSEISTWKPELDWAKTYDEALEKIQGKQYDVYLFDYRLGYGEHTGLELLHKTINLGCKSPIIILTGQDDYHVDMEAIRKGASDYLIKGQINSSLLEKSIRHAIERKRAEEAVRSAKNYSEYLVACSLDMIVAANLELTITEFNPSAEKMFGYCKSEVVGKSIRMLFADAAESKQVIDKILKEKMFEGEINKRKKNGETFPSFLSASILKDINDKEIGIVGILRDITERNRLIDQLRYNAFHDTLTNLPNRNLFMERLERLLEHSKRNRNSTFSVLFLDLDRFKVVNDSLGHLSGDKLLVLIAQKLRDCLRKSDTVARFGGDEFAILLDNVDDHFNAKFVAERILEALKAPFVLDGHKIVVSASIGIVLKGELYNRPEDILRDADTVMYRAKMLGKARYAIFNVEMHAHAMNFLQLEADLRHAIERSELVIYYQPIVSLATMEIVALESLVRWQHPQRGLILPDEFIPLAEETMEIDKVGYWVIQEACAQNKIWHDMGFSTITVTVNISLLQFRHKELPEQIGAIIKNTGLPADAFELEITESTVMESKGLVLEIFEELNKMKIHLMMDDFGIGFSSINSLKHLPFSTLKIDRSLISDIDTSSDASTIVKSIVDMAHTLKIKVIAEGVETQGQLDLLRLYNCDYVQGYLFYCPMKSDEITNLLRQKNKYISDTKSNITREFIPL